MSGQTNREAFLQTGEIVGGQYRVHNLIAQGGMAAVWDAVNEHTGKRVALKVILQSFAGNSEAIELFRREALTTSKVNHPNVVNIFDVIDHRGTTCIVMELLEGETLGNYLLKHAPLSLKTTLTLLLPAMAGVAAVNAQGVVHRDLKPGNIFLCCGSDGGILATKVLDFGISVMIRHPGETAPLPELASMLGTPAYMAPEAIQFSPTIDGRADVYGFGVLLFEALTGKLPFIGPPGMDLLERILTDPAPPVTLYRPDLPPDVVNLIACALAKDPKDRFADMDHLIRATEERLLPLLPFPRSLTPILGSLLNDPIIPQAVAKTPLPLAATPKRQKHASLAGPTRSPGRSFALGAAFVAFLVAIVWLSMPGLSIGGALAHRRALRPSITVPSITLPAAPAKVVAAPPDSPGPTPAPAAAPRIVHQEPVDAVVGSPVPSLVVTPHGSPHVAHARRPRELPSVAGEAPAPRAGRLSPSDF